MIVFTLEWSPTSALTRGEGRGADALRRLFERVPLPASTAVRTWESASARCRLTYGSHDPARLGGVEYVDADTAGFGMFCGRPISWQGDSADGRAPLDPRFYRAPAAEWASTLDGRFAAVRYDEERAALDIVTDPLGAYPLYVTADGSTRWYSNSAEALRAVRDSDELNLDTVATFVGCGWSLGGTPLWAGVDRMPRASHLSAVDGRETTRSTLAAGEIGAMFGRPLDVSAACDALVASIQALANWPGRPMILPLTGGRDSRVVLAGALTADVDFEAQTSALPHVTGFPETPDVRIARDLARQVGRRHAVTMPREDVDPWPAFPALRAASAGTFSLSAIPAGELPVWTGAVEQPSELPILHTGAGGEIARLYYGSGQQDRDALARSITGKLLKRYPPTLLTREGTMLVRSYAATWVDEQLAAGVAGQNVPDMLYLVERMSNWGGPLHGMSEFFRDLASPLWGARVLPHMLAGDAGQRSAGEFHSRVIETLRPDLAAAPYDGASYGATSRVASAATAARKARREVARRFGPAAGGAGDPLATALPRLREIAADRADHTAWEVVSRRRAQRLLARDPRRVDPRTRDQLWRLATLLLPGR